MHHINCEFNTIQKQIFYFNLFGVESNNEQNLNWLLNVFITIENDSWQNQKQN